jgi:hypothetical protein
MPENYSLNHLVLPLKIIDRIVTNVIKIIISTLHQPCRNTGQGQTLMYFCISWQVQDNPWVIIIYFCTVSACHDLILLHWLHFGVPRVAELRNELTTTRRQNNESTTTRRASRMMRVQRLGELLTVSLYWSYCLILLNVSERYWTIFI